MDELQARMAYYGRLEKDRENRLYLKMSEIMKSYCDVAIAIDETGVPAIAADLVMIEAGIAVSSGTPFSGPAAPWTLAAGGAMLSAGFFNLKNDVSSFLEKNFTKNNMGSNGFESPSPKRDRISNAEYIGNKFVDRILDGVSHNSRFGVFNGLPGVDECKVMQLETKSKENNALDHNDGNGDADRNSLPQLKPSMPEPPPPPPPPPPIEMRMGTADHQGPFNNKVGNMIVGPDAVFHNDVS